jgi:sugar lactone lactonase YvrE
MNPVVRVCSDIAGLLSEGPRWDAERGELFWVDILAGEVHVAVVGTNGDLELIRSFSVDRHVGAAAPATAGGYLLAAGTGFLHLDDEGVRELAQPEAGNPAIRMNDGACDSRGRFWAGTMAYAETPGAGRLYRLELNGSCTLVLEGLTISNGIGWSPDDSTMYLADSGAAEVYAFDFDPVSGDIERRRTLMRSGMPGAVPDGLTVDDEGAIWIALWNGGALARYAPDGTLLSTVRVGVDRPTSCAFGGPDRTTLFVTTSRDGLDSSALSHQPQAGHLLRVDGLGISGPPCDAYRGSVTWP